MRLLSALLFTSLLFGQDTPRVPSIQARGEALASVPPDEVRIQVGVVTQAPTAQAAATQNAAKLTVALAELRNAAGTGAQIQTVTYSVNPDFRYPREGGTPTITGYSATNVVEVRLRDLPLAGKVIDTATRSGANTVRGIHYTLWNEQEARTQALRQAVQEARANAQAMAAALGAKLGRVVLLVQGEGGSPQLMMMAARMEMAPSTPVSAANIDVRASVLLTVELVQ